MRATSGTLELQGQFDNIDGIIEARNGSKVEFNANNTAVTGGILTSNGTGFVSASLVDLIDLTNQGTLVLPPNSVANLAGTITNRGVIAMQGIAGQNAASLRIRDEVTLNGGGTITMTDSANNFINLASGSNTATTRLVNVDNTIRGSGSITNINITNGGNIIADQSTRLLINLSANVARTLTNTGVLRATNGATLTLQASGFINTGANIIADTGSIVQLDGNNNFVTGGTLTGTGFINAALVDLIDVTIEGTLAIPAGGIANLAGTITNRGTIALQGTNVGAFLRIRDEVTLNGGGTITMTDSANNFINLASGSNTATTRLVNVDNTIRGSGTITNIDITNGGNIIADQTNVLRVAPTDNVAHSLTNTGVLRATNGATLNLSGPRFINTGANIIADAGSIVLFSGNGQSVTGGTLRSTGHRLYQRRNLRIDRRDNRGHTGCATQL